MKMPKWQRELKSFLGINSGFILEGNIYDEYPIFEDFTQADENLQLDDFDDLEYTIHSLVNSDGGARVIFYDPLKGFYCKADTEEEQRKLISPCLKGYKYACTPSGPYQNLFYSLINKNGEPVGNEGPIPYRQIWMSEIVRNVMASTKDTDEKGDERPAPWTLFVLNFASRLEQCNLRMTDATRMYLNLMAGIQESKMIRGKKNGLILIVDKYNDIPAWVYLNNPRIREITITPPDRGTRKLYLQNSVYGGNESYQNLAQEDSKAGQALVAETEGMLCHELGQVLNIAYERQLPADQIHKAFELYKYGIMENPWNELEDNIIEHARDTLRSRVMGQDEALEKVMGVLMRAIKGLSGLQHSNAKTKPRGILFFAGPTGVGKTETAKAMAQSIFGDESACIRFDMSEYRLEQSDQKLFGAPPGYVGYEGGGQLTNAVKEHPFSILLFDEIEKASPTILDKFLQILEDGRMTDNQGNTVFFGETIIIFTSNIGLTRPVYDVFGKVERREETITIPNVEEEDTKEFREKVSTILKQGVKDYFTDNGRPELLNRLGTDNIVVFQFIGRQAAEAICTAKLKQICDNVKENNGIAIDYKNVLPHLKKKAVLERKNGGRGVGNMLEKEFLNPLAEAICSIPHKVNHLQCDMAGEKVTFHELGVRK